MAFWGTHQKTRTHCELEGSSGFITSTIWCKCTGENIPTLPSFAFLKLRSASPQSHNICYPERLGNKPQVTHAYLDSIVYRKDFIDTIEDIPNRYQEGSTVVADSEQDRILVDNLDQI